MNFISDELLIEVFIKAITLGYSDEVVDELENEIIHRNINVYKALTAENKG